MLFSFPGLYIEGYRIYISHFLFEQFAHYLTIESPAQVLWNNEIAEKKEFKAKNKKLNKKLKDLEERKAKEIVEQNNPNRISMNYVQKNDESTQTLDSINNTLTPLISNDIDSIMLDSSFKSSCSLNATTLNPTVLNIKTVDSSNASPPSLVSCTSSSLEHLGAHCHGTQHPDQHYN